MSVAEADHEERPPLYKDREPIYPKAIKGAFRRLKWWIMIVTLAIYYVTPWIRFDRGPEMPNQAVLIDLEHRRFFFFWIEIWPQEFYYIAGLLIMAGLGLFLFTSALGRVWCGYACPQTVWVDLYLHVERFFDGDRNQQIRLARQPWNAQKIIKRLSKWATWLLIAIATGGAWVFYFADAPTLAMQLFTGQADYVAYATIGILTAATFVLGGFMREQVCIYMCPWPRIQAAMLDDQSLVVTYKDWRGEPRGKLRKKAKAAEAAGTADVKRGDCIDCHACVAVCPVGIDIRDGDQLECITCALCIDACDEMMDKVGLPRGLIDYTTVEDAKLEKQGLVSVPAWKRVVRPRTLVYFTIWSAIGIGMLVTLFMRDTIDVTIAHDRNPQFVTLSDGSIRNGYEIKVLNKNHEPKSFRLSLEGPAGLRLRLEGADPSSVLVEADKLRKLRTYVTAPSGWTPADPEDESVDIRIWIEDLVTHERQSEATTLIIPR